MRTWDWMANRRLRRRWRPQVLLALLSLLLLLLLLLLLSLSTSPLSGGGGGRGASSVLPQASTTTFACSLLGDIVVPLLILREKEIRTLMCA